MSSITFCGDPVCLYTPQYGTGSEKPTIWIRGDFGDGNVVWRKYEDTPVTVYKHQRLSISIGIDASYSTHPFDWDTSHDDDQPYMDQMHENISFSCIPSDGARFTDAYMGAYVDIDKPDTTVSLNWSVWDLGACIIPNHTNNDPVDYSGTVVIYSECSREEILVNASEDETVDSGNANLAFGATMQRGKTPDYRGGLYVGYMDDPTKSDDVSPEGVARAFLKFQLPSTLIGYSICDADIYAYCCGANDGTPSGGACPGGSGGGISVAVYKCEPNWLEGTVTWPGPSIPQGFETALDTKLINDCARRLNPWFSWHVKNALPSGLLTETDTANPFAFMMRLTDESSRYDNNWAYFAEKHITDALSNSYGAVLRVIYF